MLSLAAFRYRDVLAALGGPIGMIESCRFPVRGQPMTQANAWLAPELVKKQARGLYSTADGSGTDVVPSVARHKAVSEALERWAFYATVHSSRAADFGFDVDPSSNGMSAFPGILRRQARRTAMLEAIERYSLMAWWDGLVGGQQFQTDWPGVSAVAINGPFGGVTVIAFARTDWDGYAYGHAAEESFSAACEKALIELARHEWILRSVWLKRAAGETVAPTHVLERRCLFFAGDEGHELFQSRLRRPCSRSIAPPEVICDRDIPGPWDRYATVWRFALRPPSEGYLRGGDHYFFL